MKTVLLLFACLWLQLQALCQCHLRYTDYEVILYDDFNYNDITSLKENYDLKLTQGVIGK